MNVEQLIKKGKDELKKICTDLKIAFEELDVKRTLAEAIVACEDWVNHPSFEGKDLEDDAQEIANKAKLEAMTIVQLKELCDNNEIDLVDETFTEEKREEIITEILEYEGVDFTVTPTPLSAEETTDDQLTALRKECELNEIPFDESEDVVALTEKITTFKSPNKAVATPAEPKLSDKEKAIKAIGETELSMEDVHDSIDIAIAHIKKMEKQKIKLGKPGERFNMAAQVLQRMKVNQLID